MPAPINDKTRPSITAPTRTVRVGAIILLISCALIALPILLGANSFNRFLIAFGFLGVCLGLSCLLNGALDHLRTRRKR